MAEVLEVTARLGDTILEVRHGTDVVVCGQRFALAGGDAVAREGLVEITARRVPASTPHVPRAWFEPRPLAYIAASLLVHLLAWGAAEWRHGGQVATVSAHTAMHVGVRAGPIERGVADDNDNDDDGASLHVSMKLGSHETQIGALVGAPIGDIAVDPMATMSAVQLGLTDLGVLEGAFDNVRGEPQPEFGAGRRLRGCPDGEDCGIVEGGGTGWGATCGDSPGCRYVGHGSGTGIGDRMREHVVAVPTIRLCSSDIQTPCYVVTGELDKAIIRRYIKRALPRITACYERELLVDATLTDAVSTSFLIEPSGQVRDVVASGQSQNVSACVASVIEAIRFPRSGGATQVSYPFSFVIAGT